MIIKIYTDKIIVQTQKILDFIKNNSFTHQQHLDSEISYLSDMFTMFWIYYKILDQKYYEMVKTEVSNIITKIESKAFIEGTQVRDYKPKFLYGKVDLTKLKNFLKPETLMLHSNNKPLTYQKYTDNIITTIKYAVKNPQPEVIHWISKNLLLFKNYYKRKFIPVNAVQNFYDNIRDQLIILKNQTKTTDETINTFVNQTFREYVNNKDSFGRTLPKSPPKSGFSKPKKQKYPKEILQAVDIISTSKDLDVNKKTMAEDEIKKIIISQYGKENYTKVVNNLKNGKVESKKRFLEKYPYANIGKFTFDVDLDSKGDIKNYNVFYKIDDDGNSYNITSQTFLKNKKYTKDLEYSWVTIWGDKGEVQEYKKYNYPEKVNEIRIYVTENLSFKAVFEKFDIANSKYFDVTENSYMASLYAAYIATYLCGISTKHLEYNDDTPKIITSLARYHIYFTMARFLRYPEKMKKYITKDMEKIINDNKPTIHTVKKVFVSTHEEKTHWYCRQTNRENIQNVRYARNLRGSIAGLYYDKVVGTTNLSLEDYKVFIATESNGLTKMGQLLFQQSVQSYVYSVLGAQASTRWAIVGAGAMSIQTQEIFTQKVKDTIVQDNTAVAIHNMRIAVEDTNVVLNLAISPGMILVPSNMIILKDKIYGYNNFLKLAKDEGQVHIKFGVNKNINLSTKKLPKTTAVAVAQKQPTRNKITHLQVYHEPIDYGHNIKIVSGTLISGLLLARYIL